MHIDSQRNHDLKMGMIAFLQQLGGGAEEGTILGLGDFGIDDTQTHTTHTHHGVNLVQGIHTCLQIFVFHAALFGCLALLGLGLGHEFMQRRIHQAEGQRFAIHNLERALGRLLNEGFQFFQRGKTVFLGVAQNHVAQLLQRLLTILAVEHVLNTEQTDTLCTKVDGFLCILGVVGIGAYTHGAISVNDGHEVLEAGVGSSINHVDGTFVNPTFGTIEREHVAFTIGLVANGEGLSLGIDDQILATHNAALTPSAGHQGSVGSHAATGRENTVSCTHTFNILGVGLFAHQDALDLGTAILLGLLVGKGDVTHGTTRTCRKSLGDGLVFLLVGRV